jgi:hypothetical protein
MGSKNTFKKHLLSLSICSALMSFAGQVLAEDAPAAPEADEEYTFMDSVKEGKNLTSFRLRYEDVSQDGNAPVLVPARPLEDGQALTLRSLIGWQTSPYNNFSFAVQLINVAKFSDDYNDGTSFTPINAASNQPDKLAFAKIVDPDYTGVNQLYIDWTGIKNTRVRLGRQQLNLDNVRFIGDIGFRQVMQVFDGVSVMTKAIPDTDIFVAHFESVKQINTRYRTDGALEIINAKYYLTPTESITGYAYLSSFDDLGFGNGWFGAGAANAIANQSNKTFGLRADGVHPFNPNLRAVYTAEYAKQSDYSGGDQRIDAHYYKLGGGVGIDFLTIRIDQELLSSNNSLHAFQTPFGTNHLFQGWVDKFLATPRQGIQDTFVTATYRWDDVLFFADYHVFKSDKDFAKVGGGFGDKYGKEWNVAVTYNYNKNIMAKVEYGKYTEDDQYGPALANRIRDTDKLWLTAMYTF